MKIKIAIILFLALFPGSSLYAQHFARHGHGHGQMRKEFREFKIKFLAHEMELDADQTKEFSVLYNQMENEKRQVFVATRNIERKLKNDKKASDDDYAKVTEAMAQCKIKCGEIEKKYDDRFSTFLSSKQIFKMKRAEEKFRNKLQDMHRRNHKNKNKN